MRVRSGGSDIAKKSQGTSAIMRHAHAIARWRSVWAIAAGYLGLLSVLCLPAPLALLAGIIA